MRFNYLFRRCIFLSRLFAKALSAPDILLARRKRKEWRVEGGYSTLSHPDFHCPLFLSDRTSLSQQLMYATWNLLTTGHIFRKRTPQRGQGFSYLCQDCLNRLLRLNNITLPTHLRLWLLLPRS